MPSAPTASGPPPRRRTWAKLILAVVAPVAFFAALEAGLRIGGFGRDTRFFIPDVEPGMYRTNPRFTEMFFPASFGLKPVNFRISRQKPAGSVRVFVLGESAAMGVPEPAFAIAPQIQAQLRAVRPGVQVDVFNLGITAINSHAILEIARQAVGFEPDLFVVYMGNNEVVGPYGAASVVNGGTPPRALIRAGLFLRSTRTGQLIQRTIGAMSGGADEFREWGGMEMFAGQTVAAGDPRLATVRENFEANLAAILDLAADRGIETVLSTVAVNVRDSAPFASIPVIPADGFADADLAAALGQEQEAREQTMRIVSAHPTHAEAHFRLARLLDAAGDEASARPHYFEALELDALRFRCDAGLNESIRRAALARPGTVALVDAAKALGSDRDSSKPLAGREWFFEHVHLTWEGNHALSRLLAAGAARALWGLEADRAPWLDGSACAAAVGFTALGRLAQLRNMDSLTGRPPFTQQFLYAADRARIQREIANAQAALGTQPAVRAAVGILETAVARESANPLLLFQLAAARMQTGDFRGALEIQERLARLVPPSGELAVQRAFVLKQLGRGNEAVELLLRSSREDPYYFQTYTLLAQVWLSNGEGGRAVAHFSKLAAAMPGSRVVRGALAELLARTGDWAGAEREWESMLKQAPDDESALDPLVNRLAETGRIDAAIELMKRAFDFNPRSFPNNARLAQVFSEGDDAQQAVEFMKALAASGPVNAVLHAELAARLRTLGRMDEARASLLEARRLARAENDGDTLRTVETALRETGG